MDGRPIYLNSQFCETILMRLFLAAFCLSAAITASTSLAQSDEPLTGGTGSPGHARFETSPAKEYLVARARMATMHSEAIIRQYDWMGYNFATPSVNADPFNNAAPVVRTRRIYSYPGYWIDSRSYGF
jgi:hypothetical protein